MSEGRRTALVTGASAGIGAAFADVFAAHGFDVAIVARREDRLRALAARLAAERSVRVHVIAADLSRRDAVREVCGELESRGVAVDALVNNAGYGVPGAFMASPWARHEAMLQVMLTGVTELTHALLPGMLDRRYGRIVNVASLAGLVPATAGHTLYGATKAFLIKFSEALSAEVGPRGVHVTAVCPGFTFSEFHDVTGTRDKVNRMPRWMWMDAPEVAQQGYAAVMAGTPVYVNGRVNRTIATLARLVPQRVVLGIARRASGRYRHVED